MDLSFYPIWIQKLHLIKQSVKSQRHLIHSDFLFFQWDVVGCGDLLSEKRQVLREVISWSPIKEKEYTFYKKGLVKISMNNR